MSSDQPANDEKYDLTATAAAASSKHLHANINAHIHAQQSADAAASQPVKRVPDDVTFGSSDLGSEHGSYSSVWQPLTLTGSNTHLFNSSIALIGSATLMAAVAEEHKTNGQSDALLTLPQPTAATSATNTTVAQPVYSQRRRKSNAAAVSSSPSADTQWQRQAAQMPNPSADAQRSPINGLHQASPLPATSTMHSNGMHQQQQHHIRQDSLMNQTTVSSILDDHHDLLHSSQLDNKVRQYNQQLRHNQQQQPNVTYTDMDDSLLDDRSLESIAQRVRDEQSATIKTARRPSTATRHKRLNDALAKHINSSDVSDTDELYELSYRSNHRDNHRAKRSSRSPHRSKVSSKQRSASRSRHNDSRIAKRKHRRYSLSPCSYCEDETADEQNSTLDSTLDTITSQLSDFTRVEQPPRSHSKPRSSDKKRDARHHNAPSYAPPQQHYPPYPYAYPYHLPQYPQPSQQPINIYNTQPPHQSVRHRSPHVRSRAASRPASPAQSEPVAHAPLSTSKNIPASMSDLLKQWGIQSPITAHNPYEHPTSLTAQGVMQQRQQRHQQQQQQQPMYTNPQVYEPLHDLTDVTVSTDAGDTVSTTATPRHRQPVQQPQLSNSKLRRSVSSNDHQPLRQTTQTAHKHSQRQRQGRRRSVSADDADTTLASSAYDSDNQSLADQSYAHRLPAEQVAEHVRQKVLQQIARYGEQSIDNSKIDELVRTAWQESTSNAYVAVSSAPTTYSGSPHSTAAKLAALRLEEKQKQGQREEVLLLQKRAELERLRLAELRERRKLEQQKLTSVAITHGKQTALNMQAEIKRHEEQLQAALHDAQQKTNSTQSLLAAEIKAIEHEKQRTLRDKKQIRQQRKAAEESVRQQAARELAEKQTLDTIDHALRGSQPPQTRSRSRSRAAVQSTAQHRAPSSDTYILKAGNISPRTSAILRILKDTQRKLDTYGVQQDATKSKSRMSSKSRHRSRQRISAKHEKLADFTATEDELLYDHSEKKQRKQHRSKTRDKSVDTADIHRIAMRQPVLHQPAAPQPQQHMEEVTEPDSTDLDDTDILENSPAKPVEHKQSVATPALPATQQKLGKSERRKSLVDYQAIARQHSRMHSTASQVPQLRLDQLKKHSSSREATNKPAAQTVQKPAVGNSTRIRDTISPVHINTKSKSPPIKPATVARSMRVLNVDKLDAIIDNAVARSQQNSSRGNGNAGQQAHIIRPSHLSNRSPAQHFTFASPPSQRMSHDAAVMQSQHASVRNAAMSSDSMTRQQRRQSISQQQIVSNNQHIDSRRQSVAAATAEQIVEVSEDLAEQLRPGDIYFDPVSQTYMEVMAEDGEEDEETLLTPSARGVLPPNSNPQYNTANDGSSVSDKAMQLMQKFQSSIQQINSNLWTDRHANN